MRWPVGSVQISYRSLGSEEQTMLDLIFLAGGIAFFALSVAYAYGCYRL